MKSDRFAMLAVFLTFLAGFGFGIIVAASESDDSFPDTFAISAELDAVRDIYNEVIAIRSFAESAIDGELTDPLNRLWDEPVASYISDSTADSLYSLERYVERMYDFEYDLRNLIDDLTRDLERASEYE